MAYASRGLNKAERNYCITEKELLAAVFFIQYFRQYLLGRHFIVRTDHQALVWLFSLKEPNGKIARWIEILSPYDFAIEYRPGRKQPHCDALSRCETPRDCTCSEVDMSEPLKCGPCQKCRRRAEVMVLQEKGCNTATPPNEQCNAEQIEDCLARAIDTAKAGTSTDEDIADEPPERSKHDASVRDWLHINSPEAVAEKQKLDVDIAPIFVAIENNRKPTSEEMVTKSPTTRHYWVLWDNLRLCDGVLFKYFEKNNGTGEFYQLVVPREMKQDILQQMHDSVLSGHLGTKKTKAKILQGYYWYNLKEDVVLYIRGCDVCGADKVPQRKPKAPMGHLSSGAPWDTLAIDYIGPLPKTARGNKYILVMTDHFTKYVEVVAVPNQEAEDCAMWIINHFVARWGTPLSIHTDQGRTFESHVFKELCKVLEVRKSRCSARHPRGNGQTERFNRTLIKMIKAYLAGEQEDWDRYLGCITGAYRATPNESTKLSPNLMCIGREIRLPADLVYRHQPANKQEPSACEHVSAIRERMQKAHDVARQYLELNAKRSKADTMPTRLTTDTKPAM